MPKYVEHVEIGERYVLQNGELLKVDGTKAELEFKPGVDVEGKDDEETRDDSPEGHEED